MQRIEWAHAGGSEPGGLDLAEDERVAVEGNEVELAPPGAVVALDDLESTPAQMLSGDLLAATAHKPADVFLHNGDGRAT